MKEKIPIIAIISILLLSAVSLSAMGSITDVELPPPEEPYVTMRATDGTNSWFDMEIKDVPSGYDILDGIYPGWCAQKDVPMTRNVNHAVNLYSSYDPNMPESYRSENWSKINYVLNYGQGNKNSIQEVIWYYISLGSSPSNLDAQAMISDADQYGSDFVPEEGQILAIIVEGVETIQRSFFEFTIPTSSSNESNDSSFDPTPSTTGRKNHAPTADATAGEPYTGFTRGEITFDGSKSYDLDGIIISWKWDFGDGNTGSGEIVKHSYATPGNYTVILKVKDEKGATDSYTTTATITKGNNPPSRPTISGPISGRKNTSYEFTAVSTDPDDDSLQYIFNWGDGETTTTSYYPSGTPTTQMHSWNAPGHYIITVKASDNNIESEVASVDMLIDILYVQNIGYLIAEGNDGKYNGFYGSKAGIKTEVEMLDNGNYLLDINGDDIWNYEYDPESDELSIYYEQPILEYMLVAILLIVCVILFFVLAIGKKNVET